MLPSVIIQIQLQGLQDLHGTLVWKLKFLPLNRCRHRHPQEVLHLHAWSLDYFEARSLNKSLLLKHQFTTFANASGRAVLQGERWTVTYTLIGELSLSCNRSKLQLRENVKTSRSLVVASANGLSSCWGREKFPSSRGFSFTVSTTKVTTSIVVKRRYVVWPEAQLGT